MKRVTVVLIFMILICGCGNNNSNIDKAMSLRDSLLSANKCFFSVQINADYQSECYSFRMDCTADEKGNINFSITAPETIAGITGSISENDGKLTFDDKYLVFAPFIDGLISPVSAPWMFMNTLRSGYISGCLEDENGSTFVFNDSFQDSALELMITMDANSIPTSAEIFWQGRRAVTLVVENFTIV